MKIHETQKQYIDLSDITLTGRVLDIGGGGEGVISRHSGNKVIAIDKLAEELAETPDIGTKVIMDACNLKFIDEYFNNITCFYTLMYMDLSQIEQFLSEAYRVIKAGAALWIWDSNIPAVISADVFVVNLEVKISKNLSITTGYGVSWQKEQSYGGIKAACEKAGFAFQDGSDENDSFSLRFCRL